MQAIGGGSPLLDQAGAIADELAQFALLTVGHVAGFQQAMTEQVSDPLRVVDVGLAARYGLQMLRVDQQQLEAFLEQVEYRLPVTAGALHRDVRHAPLRQPLAQLLQVVAHRAK